MKDRKTEDRRVKSIKVSENKRTSIRRQEDIDNIKAYYFVLMLISTTLLTIGIISYIWGR